MIFNNPSFLVVSLTAVVALYVVCAPRFNSLLYRPLLFHPWQLANEPVAPPLCGVPGENVYFPSANGKILNGWYYKNPHAHFTVLFSHGNGGNVAVRTDIVQLLLECSLSVLIYDYEGYGESLGKPSVEGICQDGVGAYKYLTSNRMINPDSIILYGESLGTGVSSYLASKFACRALILQSGFASLRRISCELFPVLNVYPDWLYPEPPLNTASILANQHPPLLIIHGVKDALIPFAHAQTLLDCAKEPKTLIELPATGHADIFATAAPLFVSSVRKFISSLR
jgi:fermentation-respiration switch protein FrsA (DUF1100 family)